MACAVCRGEECQDERRADRSSFAAAVLAGQGVSKAWFASVLRADLWTGARLSLAEHRLQ